MDLYLNNYYAFILYYSHVLHYLLIYYAFILMGVQVLLDKCSS